MTEEDEFEKVPEYYVVKLRRKGYYHYVLCEMIGSCNYPVDGSSQEDARPDFLPQEVLEKMLQEQKSLNRDSEVVECVVLCAPGDATAPWTARSARSQSGGKGQSGDR